ncbi:MAG: hypothetical protein K5839_03585 [Treponemataceae bacterium]|nr:hypothetical protein [Treponemataceae bacterium]
MDNEGKDEIQEENLVFRYNRDERVSKASPTVKAHYDGTEAKPPKGLFKALVHTKSSRYMLYTLILVLAFFFGIYFFGSRSNVDSLNGTKYSLTAFSFEDNVYISLKLTPEDIEKNEAENKINVQICTIDNENQITNKVSFTEKDIKDDYIRAVFVNHDIISVTAEISDQAEEKTLNLSCKVEEK